MFAKVTLLALMISVVWHKCSCQSGDFTLCNGDVDISACSNHTCNFTIPSLDYEISTDVDSIQIQLCTSYSELSTVVTFNNVSHVKLSGNSTYWSEVHCTGKQSGIEFVGVRSIHIENFQFFGCGMDVFYTTGIEAASIFILNGEHVALNNIVFAFSKDTAVAMINVGNSSTSNCIFGDLLQPKSNRSRGLYLEIGENNTYHYIHGSSFTANWAAASLCSIAFSTIPSYGAGMTIIFHNSFGNLVEISECRFKHNFAKLGGALYAKFNSSQDNLVLLTESEFYQNEATEGGGVALEFGMETLISTNNTVRVVGCNFTENNASKGGSLYIISAVPPPCKWVQNRLELENSTFLGNTAFKGAAIDANLELFDTEGELPSYSLMTIELNDTRYEDNFVRMKRRANSRHQTCQGTIRTVQGVELIISGMLQMSNNTGSALCLKSSNVSFMPNSMSIFRGNSGQQGGAIAIMREESQAKVYHNCSILFQENTALTHGGAIFQEFGKQCFLKRESEANVKLLLKFSNNAAKHYGNSIYVATIQPCFIYDEFIHTINDLTEFLPNIANFSFTPERKSDISTKSGNITIVPEKLVPGQVANIILKDETNTSVEAIFMVSENLSTKSSGVSLEASLMPNTGNSQIRLLGRPQSKINLLISLLDQPDFQVSFSIEFAKCPPGFYYDPHSRACLCSGNSLNISNRYIGIENCPPNTFQASLLTGHWAGYVNRSNGNENEGVFLTGYCPRGFCSKTNGTASGVLLPAHIPSSYDLSSTVCHENREGILCSRCIANHSADFTTYRKCLPDEECRLGFLYFILSQIVPITIAFSVMVASDTSLTSGAVSSVIFYSQMFPFLVVTANDFIWFEKNSYNLLKGLRLITAMFNLRFFALGEFSFCLWKGITLLDIAAINYATVVYCLILVILTVKVFTPCVGKLRSRKHKLLKQQSSKSIIHGLTGFLVISYSQSTSISLYIMAYVRLYGIGMKPNKYLVFFDAGLEYFKGKHLFYAIPAVFILVFMSLIPPLLILVYPLCYRVLALCRIQESKFTKGLCRAIPLEKYKPLFDSFQESFKDKHRYFAGLYFIFRLVIITTFVTIRELANYYLFLEIELVIMLMSVAYFQPHKKDWHNVLDALIFLLMIIINTGTIFLYRRRSEDSRIQYSFEYTDIYQVLLAYLPVLYLLAYVILKGIVIVKKRFMKKGKRLEEDEDFVITALSQHENPTKFEYSLFQGRELSH